MAGTDSSDDPQGLMKQFDELDAAEDTPDVPAVTDEAAGAKTADADAAAAAVTDEQSGSKTNEADKGKTTQGQEAAGLNEEDAAGVATRDGKHVIPYSVLKSERERAARAEQLLQEATQKTEQLQAQLDGKNGGQGANNGEGARTTDGNAAKVDELPDEELEALKEDFPTVYKALMAQKTLTQALESKLKPVEDTVRSQEQNAARTAADEVQSAIDSIPVLAHIQATDREAWKQAIAFDKLLRQNPTWKDKPLNERFTHVAKLLEDTNGPITLPGKKEPASSKNPDPEAVAKAAKAKAKEADTTGAIPGSLSDFPAGQAAASDERQAVEQMTAQQLAAKFSNMTPEQMDTYINNL